MPTTEVADQSGARISVEVVLTVSHRVVVDLEGTTHQTMDELKAAALAVFHRDPLTREPRTDAKWRAQFNSRTNIHVGSEQVDLTALTTRPQSR